jgi:methyl coenzyme M reductase subunit C-like uncharacterized protein (methanogenesis marker protein 7)
MRKHDAIYATHTNIVVIRGDNAFDAQGNPVTYNEAIVQAYIDANIYKEKRVQEYPPITDQLDMIFHNGIDAWKEQIQAVKTKYPKSN